MRKMLLAFSLGALLAALSACGDNDKPPLTPDSDGDGGSSAPPAPSK